MTLRPRGRNIKRPEQDLQIQIADFLRVATIPPAQWWHVPNGVGMSKTQRAMRQKMGLTPGVHDLHFAWAGMPPNYIGMFGTIELKAKDGRATAAQMNFGYDLIACGHRWAECKSLDEVIETLKRWGFPLRATA